MRIRYERDYGEFKKLSASEMIAKMKDGDSLTFFNRAQSFSSEVSRRHGEYHIVHFCGHPDHPPQDTAYCIDQDELVYYLDGFKVDCFFVIKRSVS